MYCSILWCVYKYFLGYRTQTPTKTMSISPRALYRTSSHNISSAFRVRFGPKFSAASTFHNVVWVCVCVCVIRVKYYTHHHYYLNTGSILLILRYTQFSHHTYSFNELSVVVYSVFVRFLCENQGRIKYIFVLFKSKVYWFLVKISVKWIIKSELDKVHIGFSCWMFQNNGLFGIFFQTTTKLT